MIDTTQPFSLYARADVVYDGRAYSTLESGNYLIIHKGDGSLLIHNNKTTQPANYQCPKSLLQYQEKKVRPPNIFGECYLVSTNGNEIITINIYEILQLTYLQRWSDSEIVITRTEKELVDKLVNNWNNYIDDEVGTIEREFKTDHGAIDVLGISNDYQVVVEAKRGKSGMPDAAQLRRYVEVLEEDFDDVRGYLVSPEIGKKALAFLKKYGYGWVKIDFDD